MTSAVQGFLDGAFTRSGDAITFMRNGAFVDCNAAMLRMLRYDDKAEYLAQTVATISPEFQADGRSSDVAAAELMRQAAREGHALFEWLHLRRDGSIFPTEVMIVLFDIEGDEGLAVTVRDISARKRDEAEIARQREALHQSEKLAAIGSLLAGVAHELNNPLSIVINHSVILQDVSPHEATRERAAKIEAAAGRCARIVKSFLAIARQKTPTYCAVSLADAVDKALDLTVYGLRARGIAVEQAIDPAAPAIRADEDQIIQVAMNLIVNAQQALEGVPGGDRRLRIEIRATGGSGGSVALAVHDNGPGVPDAIRGRVFDPFFTTKEVGAGTGIGLALCRNIVDAHRGTIAVDRSPLGGARFEVVLPVDGGAADEGVAAPGAATNRGGARILVVEDEPELADVLRDVLGGAGVRLDVAGDGRAALEMIARVDYDIVVSDLHMPVMDGQALHEALTAARSPLAERMIFLSGDLLSSRNAAFLESNGNRYLEKPFAPAEIREAVRQVLGAQRP